MRTREEVRRGVTALLDARDPKPEQSCPSLNGVCVTARAGKGLTFVFERRVRRPADALAPCGGAYETLRTPGLGSGGRDDEAQSVNMRRRHGATSKWCRSRKTS